MNEIAKNDPLVSIVLPTLNGSHYIATSIESCLKQSYQHFELIVVVDGRTIDNTVEILKGYSDSRIRIFYNQPSVGGLPGSLNIGFSQARGDYYTWTSDDNYYELDALEVMVSYLKENPDVGLVYTGYWFVDEVGNIIEESKLLPPDSLTATNPVGSCFLYPREVAKRAGQYDVNFSMAEDVEFWMRIFKLSKIAMIEGKYYYHRSHRESLTIKNYGAYLALRRLADASRKHFGISFFKYQQRIAKAFIEEAFFAYQKRDFKHVLPCIWNGALRNPLWLRERGVLSIGMRSLLKVVRSDTSVPN